ncbi:MAG: CTL/SLC44 family protein [Candidatus Lokiarchaeota archaeon]|nr:CTL/SLC44 family protein [Candidatus Lokiarchaeota archaeon]
MGKETYKDYFDHGEFQYKQYLKSGRLYVGAALLLAILVVVFLYYTGVSGWNVYQKVQAAIPFITTPVQGITELVMSHKGEVLAIIILAVFASYIASILALNLLKLIGALFIWLLTALTAGLSILLVYLAKDFQGYEYLFLLGAVIPPVVLAFFWKKMKIASRLINLTADLLMKNKRMFWNGLYFGALYLILSAGIWAVYIDKFIQITADFEKFIMDIQSTDMSGDWFVVGMTMLYFFLVQIAYNYYYGATVHMAHAFYRGAREGHLDGFRVLNRRFRPIFTYAVFSSILYTIKWILSQMAKRSKDTERLSKIGIKVVLKGKLMPGLINKKSITQKIANWAIRMLEKLWLLINFFTLPAIVIENKNAPSAIKKSVEYVGANAVDVFIRQTSIRSVFGFTKVIFVLLCAGAGAIVGLWFKDRFNMDVTAAMIVFAIVFGVGAGVPAWVMGKNLDIVYVSFLYCYLLDEDLKKEGITPPSKFFGTTDIRDGKEDKMTRQRWVTAVVGVVLACVAIGCYGYNIYVLINGTDVIMADFDAFHAWLEQISFFAGYGALGMMLALVFSALARRKYISIAIVVSIAVALLMVCYINWWRPASPPVWTTGNELTEFKIVVGCLVCVVIGSWLLGTIVEIYLLTHDLNVAINEQLVRRMEAAKAPVDAAPVPDAKP